MDNLSFTTHVFKHVSGVKDSADLLEEILSKSPGDQLAISKEILETIIEVLRGDAKLIQQLFEENQFITDRVASIMTKNHPKNV